MVPTPCDSTASMSVFGEVPLCEGEGERESERERGIERGRERARATEIV
jgi:hypothetical protein